MPAPPSSSVLPQRLASFQLLVARMQELILQDVVLVETHQQVCMLRVPVIAIYFNVVESGYVLRCMQARWTVEGQELDDAGRRDRFVVGRECRIACCRWHERIWPRHDMLFADLQT